MLGLRHAIRRLIGTPGFSLVAVVTMALGIGANVAVFSLLDALVLRELPVAHPETLTSVFLTMRNGTEAGLSFPAFAELRDHTNAFTSVMACVCDEVLPVETQGEVGRRDVSAVTGNFFSELGIRPYLGRLLAPDDVDLGSFSASHLAVLSYAFWQNRFGADATVVGRTLKVEGVPYTIVGVAPRTFHGLGRAIEPDLIVPLTATEQAWTQGNVLWLTVIGRRAPGTTVEQARAQVEAKWPGILAGTMPAGFAGIRRDNFLAIKPVVIDVTTRADRFTRAQFTRALTIVLGLAGFVLALACVNLAGLMLTRMTDRAHDMGIQLALGASRWRIARETLTEGLLVSAAGAVVGVAIAPTVARTVSDMTLSGMLPSTLDVRLDVRVLAVSVAMTCITGVLFSALPAWRATRGDALGVLQRRDRRFTGRRRLGQAVVVAQVALAVMLVTNAGLLIRTLQILRGASLGFDATDLTATQIERRTGVASLTDEGLHALVDRASVLPGVSQASMSIGVPAGGGSLADLVAPMAKSGDEVRCEVDAVTPGYFQMLGLPRIAGREFAWSDRPGGGVAIVSESLARRLSGDRSALGERIRIGFLPQTQNLEIVGVVGDARLHDIKSVNPYAVYYPLPTNMANTLIVKGRGVGARELRQMLDQQGFEFITAPSTIAAVEDRALTKERLMAMLAAFFGGLALLLVAVGVHGLMASMVASRTKEIGIRLALGATPGGVRRGVVVNGVTIALLGVALGLCGLPAAVGLTRALVVGITPHDPVTLLAVPAVILLSGLLACVAPAIRAARVDVMDALRAE